MIFICVYIGDQIPTFTELNKYIVPKFSAAWEKLGAVLSLDENQLAIISKNNAYNPHRSEDCYREMLKKWWYQIHTSATWDVLEDAVKTIMMPDDSASSICYATGTL